MMYKAIALIMWIGGIIIAKGFWVTVACICLPFVAWYIFLERLLQIWGLI